MTRRVPVAKTFAPEHLKALTRAVKGLEAEGLATKIGKHAGRPAQKLLDKLPGPLASILNRAIEKAVLKALDFAIKSLDPKDRRKPKPGVTAAFAGLSGGLSGLVGLAGLAVELPVTTLLMLRSVAAIARHMGEDLTTVQARLACVAVFAFGGPEKGDPEVGYYASRALLGKLASDVSTLMIERGGAAATAPSAAAFVGEVTTRFSATVWERAAASAAPLIGVLGGASLNVIFTNHFNAIAWSHFTIRRLERIYGEEIVRAHYGRISAGLGSKTNRRSPARAG
jgi:hypothetical protein